MDKRKIHNSKCFFTIILTAILSHGSLIYANDNAPEIYDYPGCSGFDLRIESWNGNTQVVDLSDANGTKQIIYAGKGSQLKFINLSNEQTFETKANGATNQYYKYNNDGSQLVRLTGHSILILFPNDTNGPSTTLYVGEVEVMIDNNGIFTVQSENGRKTDICAALSDLTP